MKALTLLLTLLALCSCASTKEASVSDTANTFISSLSEDQKKLALMEFDTKERHNWTFLPTKFTKTKMRKGFRIKDMSEEQLKKTFDIVKAITSEAGFNKSIAIMEYETIMSILEKNPVMRDSKKYFISIFGTTAKEGRWALRYEGHHLCLNFTIEDDEIISATPLFLGVNPGRVIDNAGTNHKVGTRLLAVQEDLGFELIKSFSAEQKKAAVVSKGNPETMRSYDAAPVPMKKAGVAVKNFTKEQKAIFKKLLYTFTQTVEKGFAQESNYELDAEMEKMYFSWYGNTEDVKIPHSFIIDGPVSYIRFSNWATDSLKTKANHIHSLWRNRVKDFGYKIEMSK